MDTTTHKTAAAVVGKESEVERLQLAAAVNAAVESAAIDTLQRTLAEASGALEIAEARESTASTRANRVEEHRNALEKGIDRLESVLCGTEEISEEEVVTLRDHARVVAEELTNLDEIGDPTEISPLQHGAAVFHDDIVAQVFERLLEGSQGALDCSDASGVVLCELLISKLPNGDRLAFVSPAVWQPVAAWLTKKARRMREKAQHHERLLLDMNQEIDLLSSELKEC
ncbi:unnamed protein product [Phytomonas sp. EM1]|nr:unnamed protein product [Phytomonas sp. EM1]|eukprot:CCW62490.1 unnamed protein product [Phytomonas sp. isolate EM1]